MHCPLRTTLAVAVFLLFPIPSFAQQEVFIPDSATSLGQLIQDSSVIGMYELSSISSDGMTLTYKKVTNLKGTGCPVTLAHHFKDSSEDDKAALKQLSVGALALCFTGRQETICLGHAWYYHGKITQRKVEDVHFNRDYAKTYYGAAETFRDRVLAILKGQEVTITAAYIPPDGNDVYSSPSMHRLPGGAEHVWRIKASLKILNLESIHDESAYFVGWGKGGPEMAPTLLTLLRDKDSRIKAAAALDLAQLVPGVGDAVVPLQEALKDQDPLVRISLPCAVDHGSAGCFPGTHPDQGIESARRILAN